MLNNPIDIHRHPIYQLVPDVQNICSPLLERLNINFFNYIKAYPDGSRYFLTDSKDFVEQYFINQQYQYELFNFLDQMPDYMSGMSLWDGCQDNHQVCKLFVDTQQKLKLGYVLFIYEKYPTYAESFAFGIQKNVTHGSQVILKNIDILKRFILHFKDKGRPIIQKVEKHSFEVLSNPESEYTNPFFWGLEEQKKQDAFKVLKVDKIYLDDEYDNVFLKISEVKVVQLMLQGLTYKKIAEQLHISPKTVEYRVEKVKDKLQVKTKKALLSTVIEHNYIELFNTAVPPTD